MTEAHGGKFELILFWENNSERTFLAPVSTWHNVVVVAALDPVVPGVEHETVAAFLQSPRAILARPVLVAVNVVCEISVQFLTIIILFAFCRPLVAVVVVDIVIVVLFGTPLSKCCKRSNEAKEINNRVNAYLRPYLRHSI